MFNLKTKSLDLRNLRATDFKNNKRVIVPELSNDNDEITRNNLKNELKKVFVKYKNENCDKDGNLKENNLDKKQVNTIKKFSKKMKKEGWICYETDKTGNLTVDTLKNFSDKMGLL